MIDHGPLMQLREALITHGAKRVGESHMLSRTAAITAMAALIF